MSHNTAAARHKCFSVKQQGRVLGTTMTCHISHKLRSTISQFDIPEPRLWLPNKTTNAVHRTWPRRTRRSHKPTTANRQPCTARAQQPPRTRLWKAEHSARARHAPCSRNARGPGMPNNISCDEHVTFKLRVRWTMIATNGHGTTKTTDGSYNYMKLNSRIRRPSDSLPQRGHHGHC